MDMDQDASNEPSPKVLGPIGAEIGQNSRLAVPLWKFDLCRDGVSEMSMETYGFFELLTPPCSSRVNSPGLGTP